jgi:hypothetical protein
MQQGTFGCSCQSKCNAFISPAAVTCADFCCNCLLSNRFKACLNANNGAHSHILQLAKVLEQGTPSMARVLAAERGVALPGASSIDPQRCVALCAPAWPLIAVRT